MEENGLNHLLCHGDQIDLVWPSVAEYMASAAERADLPEFNLQVAYDDVKQNRGELWVFHDEARVWGIVVGRFNIYHGFPVYELYVTAGDEMENWLGKIRDIEERARSLGAKRLDIHGRRGWLRVFKEQNFHELYTAVGKELTDV